MELLVVLCAHTHVHINCLSSCSYILQMFEEQSAKKRVLKKLMTASGLPLSWLVAAIARGDMDSREKSQDRNQVI